MNSFENNRFLDVSFELDLKALGVERIQADYWSNADHQNQLTLQCGASNNHVMLAGTQHTVSTLGSSRHESRLFDDCSDDEDNLSLGSFGADSFGEEECELDDTCLLGGSYHNTEDKGHSRDTYFEKAIDKALSINTYDLAQGSHHGGVADEEELPSQRLLEANATAPSLDFDQSTASFHESFASIVSQQGDQEGSISSLTNAMEKLNACMSRTAESRRRVQGLLETDNKTALTEKTTTTLNDSSSCDFGNSCSSIMSQASTVTAKSSNSRRSRTGGSSSSSTMKKKSRARRARRAMKKSGISRTGIAFRPGLAAFLKSNESGESG